ncbi:lysophospholipid acyltransferase family protein [bacterium]|nr:lysophospholipid acyltransferase family protein [candidate division CSSED10-310 bacterium]
MNSTPDSRRSWLDSLVAAPVLLLYRAFRSLSRESAEKAGRWIGYLAFILGIRRQVLRDNMSIAFPDTSFADRNRMIRNVYLNTGRFLGNWLTMPKRLGRIADEVTLLHPEIVRQADEQGRGLLICSAHLGNWELLASYCAENLSPHLTIVRHKLSNSRLDRWFTDVHEMMGFGDVIKGQSVIEIFRRLHRREHIGMLVDQSGRGSGIWIPFFGRPTSFHRGPGVIASKTGAAVVTAFCVPSVFGKWEIRVRALTVLLTGDLELDTYAVMREYARHLEEIIREFPDWYFWYHRRWKTPVPAEVSDRWNRGELA